MRKQTDEITRLLLYVMALFEERLSLDYVSYDVEFDGRRFHLDSQTPKEERHAFIRLVVGECLDQIVIGNYKRAWDPLLNFTVPLREEIVSPISAEQYALTKEEASCKSKPLNVDSYSLIVERPDLDDDQKEAMLLEKIKET
jgi:hypothetical protein